MGLLGLEPTVQIWAIPVEKSGLEGDRIWWTPLFPLPSWDWSTPLPPFPHAPHSNKPLPASIPSSPCPSFGPWPYLQQVVQASGLYRPLCQHQEPPCCWNVPYSTFAISPAEVSIGLCHKKPHVRLRISGWGTGPVSGLYPSDLRWWLTKWNYFPHKHSYTWKMGLSLRRWSQIVSPW